LIAGSSRYADPGLTARFGSGNPCTDSQAFYRDMPMKEHVAFFQSQLLLFKKVLEYLNLPSRAIVREPLPPPSLGYRSSLFPGIHGVTEL
jgi:hypothetical protein